MSITQSTGCDKLQVLGSTWTNPQIFIMMIQNPLLTIFEDEISTTVKRMKHDTPADVVRRELVICYPTHAAGFVMIIKIHDRSN
jgi:hypothetical protein